MRYDACPSCGSPSIILFQHRLCVFVGCASFDQRTYEERAAEATSPLADEPPVRPRDPWAQDDSG